MHKCLVEIYRVGNLLLCEAAIHRPCSPRISMTTLITGINRSERQRCVALNEPRCTELDGSIHHPLVCHWSAATSPKRPIMMGYVADERFHAPVNPMQRERQGHHNDG